MITLCNHQRPADQCHACYTKRWRQGPAGEEHRRREADRYRADPEPIKARARAWHAAHYVPRPRPSLSRRFWAKVDQSGECWVWTGAKTGKGTKAGRYGEIHVNGKPERAHRVSWFLEHGRWPSGLMLHRCDNPPCVRPDHLFEGDQTVNMRDAATKGRTRSRR